MENFRCPQHDIPNHLYRVQHASSRTEYSRRGYELVAQNLHSVEDFCSSVENRFRWGSRTAKPYISCFSDKNFAENWALAEPWRAFQPATSKWELLTIRTEWMPHVCIFKFSDLVNCLELKIPYKAAQQVQGAYLCPCRVSNLAVE